MDDRTSTVSGWGRNKYATVKVLKPINLKQLQQLIKDASPKSLIARGLGRSYGDAAQIDKGCVIDLSSFDQVSLNREIGTVRVGAGVSFEELIRVLLPEGFFLPVTPGTRKVTVGGAIAADVHGKNHHLDGSFGSHVKSILLVDGSGELIELTPNGKGREGDKKKFWATIGGMGLTGVIIEATFSLITVQTSFVSVDTNRCADLDSLMKAMVDADTKYRYTVAWVDSLHPKGRGVLTSGNHAFFDELSEEQKKEPLFYNPQALAEAPSLFPGGFLNKFTVRAFNEAWYRKSPSHQVGELQQIAKYFHPLDGIKEWNRIYGAAGFLQYQFVVPDQASYLVGHTLDKLRSISAPSFLTVLKRFGKSNSALLSFPKPGWTLAVDIPWNLKGLFDVLNQLDNDIADVGGRIYLAKDSRQSAAIFKKTYPFFEDWKEIKETMDPRGVFISDISKRLEMDRL